MISFELVSIRFAILFLYFISHHQVQAGEYRQKLFLQLRNIIYLADCSVTRTRGPQIIVPVDFHNNMQMLIQHQNNGCLEDSDLEKKHKPQT